MENLITSKCVESLKFEEKSSVNVDRVGKINLGVLKYEKKSSGRTQTTWKSSL